MTLWVRFRHADTTGFGQLAGDHILVHRGDLFATPTPTGETIPLSDARLLAPVTPRKFIGLWNNVRAVAEAQDLGIPDYPLHFLKSPDSIIGPGDDITAPPGHTGRVCYEGELGVVVGKTLRHAPDDATAEAAILGYTCVNDVTAADLFGDNPKFEQWARAKSCDSFGPVGPAIATGLDWRTLTIRTTIQGRDRQNYPAADLILPPPAILRLLSQEMTLHPGDLITCGTGKGVLPMRPNTEVTITIDGIGALTNTYRGAA